MHTNKINVIFLITSFKNANTGIGGHYRSTSQFASALQSQYDVTVFTVGDLPSPVLQSTPQYRHIKSDGLSDVVSLRRIKSHIAEIGSEASTFLVSVGGIKSYLYAALASIGVPLINVIHLKPGGTPANKNYKLLNGVPIVAFSPVDQKIFMSLDERRPVHLIAARVSEVKRNDDYLNKFKEKYLITDELRDSFKIFIICRLTTEKKPALRIILDQLASLKEHFYFTPIIVGAVQNKEFKVEVANELNSLGGILVTDYEFTSNAASSLFFADAYCGIGRSALEACSLAIPTFIPCGDEQSPSLFMLTSENWKEFLTENFTHRVSIDSLIRTETIGIAMLQSHKSLIESKARKMAVTFQRELDVGGSIEKWGELFDEVNGSYKISKARLFYQFIYYQFLRIKALIKRLFAR